MYTYLRFPDFKRKALTLSYDDGRIYDRKLIDIMSKHGIKGTFNLNSSSVGRENYVTEKELNDLYYGRGQEIAIHGENHISLPDYDIAVATRELISDRQKLEEMTGRVIKGMAYAFGTFFSKDSEGAHVLTCSGIKYARAIDSTHAFDMPQDFKCWQPTSHHADCHLKELCDKFLGLEETPWHFRNGPVLFYLWGHSYEFENNKQWDLIEWFCDYMGKKEDIWYATNGEIYDYVTAYNRLEWSVNGKTVYNPTTTDVYVCICGAKYVIKSGETVTLK